jgi:phage head maturation protease
MKLFAPIAKIDETQRLVFGYASTEMLDSQGEIVRKEAIEAALPDYMRFANIREMHQPSAIGVAKEAELDGKGLHLAAKIVDDDAWRKVVEGVYKGFSIGGRVTARDSSASHVITGVDLLEISLVDRPANPEAVIELYKARPDDASRADAAKAGARHSREDFARVQSMHDVAVELGAKCPTHAGDSPTKHAFSEDLAKLQAERDAEAGELARLRTLVSPLGDAVAALQKRLEALEAQPLAPKAMAKALGVTKEEDGRAAAGGTFAGETMVDFIARLQSLPTDKRAFELTKLAMKFPRPMTR